MPFTFNPLSGQFDFYDKVSSLSDLTTKDHDLLDGLGDDDHTQYYLTAGTRAMTKALIDAPSVDFTMESVGRIAGITFSGGGLNDAVQSGVYTGVTDSTFTVQIDATGTPDTFQWRKDSGSWTTGVAITGAAQLLQEGVYITFGATTGHTLSASWTITVKGNNLEIRNSNNDNDLLFNVTRNSVAQDFMKIVSSGKSGNTTPTLLLGDGTRALDTNGVLQIKGTNAITGVGVGASMQPTVQGGNWVMLYGNPTNNTTSTNMIAFWLTPTVTSVAQQVEMFRFQPAAHAAGLNDTLKIIAETGYNRNYFAFAANDASTIAINQIAMGGAISAFDSGFTLPTFTENMITLTGGLTRSSGTGGSFNQKGIRFVGFGTQSGLTGSDSVRAIDANGGLFSHRYDYGTNNKLLFGAGEDAAIGYDGTDFILDTALVGSGVLRFNASSNWAANNAQTVTVGNVGPGGSAVSIQKWLTVKDNSGNTYYIPAFG